MKRKILNFNTDWFFLDKDIEGAKGIDFSQSGMEKVNLPHPNRILPHHYFEESDYQFVSWYRRPFYLEEEYKGKRVIVEFDGVMTVAEIYVNGQFVGEHKGGYTSFSFDITDYLLSGENNLLAVRVDSSQRKDIPPEGNLVDYLLFGGIYRDVKMVIVDPVYINWSFIELKDVNLEAGVIKPRFELVNTTGNRQKIVLNSQVINKEGKVVAMVESRHLLEPGVTSLEQPEVKIKRT